MTENDQAERATQRLAAQNARLELLSQVTGELLFARDVGVMLTRLFERIRGVLGLDAYFHYALDDHGGLRLESYAGVDERALHDAHRLRLGEGVCGQVAQSGVACVISGVQASSEPRYEYARRCGLDAYACMPLLAGGRVVGTLGFGRTRADPFHEDEIRFLRTLCGYVAVARERVRSERRLLEQAERLRQADRHKDEFLAILAHELRNPLAPIANAARLLKTLYPHDPALERWRSSIERQTDHLTRLVDDLLDVARLSRGKIVLRREPVNVATFVATALESVGPMFEAKAHRFDMWMPEVPACVMGDPTRLSQIVANLLGNAAKYTPPGGQIELDARREGSSLVITVRDNGPGIDPALLPTLFQLFTQADRSLDRTQGGLGLGLALTRQLVDLHGGSVEARSEGPGRGSEFVVRLPCTDGARMPREPGSAAPERRGIESRRVMVVDDNPDAAESAAALLTLGGHEVRVAFDGIEALETARHFRPEVMIIDIGLPRMDGYELAMRLRALPETRDALLIALTGYGQSEAVRRSMDAGFDRHFVKPLDPEVLLDIVASCPPAVESDANAE